MPDGSRFSSATVESSTPASRFAPAGVYTTPVPLPAYHAPLPLRQDGDVQLLSFVQSHDARRLSGEIAVRNRAYDKRVTVRVTTNGWRSFVDVAAAFSHSVDESQDIFAYELLLPTPPARGRSRDRAHHVELAVAYSSAGRTCRDNNYRDNFSFTVRPETESYRRLDTPKRRRRPKRRAPLLGSAERERAADEAASHLQRSLEARFFAGGRAGDQIHDRAACTRSQQLPVALRHDADAFASVWLDRCRRVDRGAFDASVFGPPQAAPDESPNVALLRAHRRLRAFSPWRPLLLTGPPSPPVASTSSAPALTAPECVEATSLEEPEPEPEPEPLFKPSRKGKGKARGLHDVR